MLRLGDAQSGAQCNMILVHEQCSFIFVVL